MKPPMRTARRAPMKLSAMKPRLPTPVLERVASEVLRPRLAYLCDAMAEAVGVAPDHPAVVRSAISLTSQMHGLMWGERMRTVVPGFEPSADRLDEIADHITRFSLGGLTAVVVAPEAAASSVVAPSTRDRKSTRLNSSHT